MTPINSRKLPPLPMKENNKLDQGSGHRQNGELLEMKLIGEIAGRFMVKSYQRGYRWEKVEVECLLNDIWNTDGSSYCLQPVVVKQLNDGEWELIDGQQRLTTLYLRASNKMD